MEAKKTLECIVEAIAEYYRAEKNCSVKSDSIGSAVIKFEINSTRVLAVRLEADEFIAIQGAWEGSPMSYIEMVSEVQDNGVRGERNSKFWAGKSIEMGGKIYKGRIEDVLGGKYAQLEGLDERSFVYGFGQVKEAIQYRLEEAYRG